MREPRPRVRLVLTIALSMVVAAIGRATVLVPADLSDLVRESRVIVHGRVVDTTAVWAEERRRIDTVVTLEADTYLKGNVGDTVTFRAPGGALGRYRSVMIGAPVFREGDEVVLFLNAQGPAMLHVLGLSQGVFRVVMDQETGEKLVLPPPLVAGVEAAPVRRGDATRRPMPLERFSDRVRELLTGGAR